MRKRRRRGSNSADAHTGSSAEEGVSLEGLLAVLSRTDVLLDLEALIVLMCVVMLLMLSLVLLRRMRSRGRGGEMVLGNGLYCGRV